MMRRFLIGGLFILVLFSHTIGSSGCANIVPPQGGPRDTLPPVLVSATPADSTVNFRGNRITLTFDEYVDLQEVQNNLLFTPIFENTPVVEARLQTLTIRLRDSLEANTTYIFNFGNAIRDIHESNVLKNFDYTFSTGPALDSLELKGRVLLAETGAVDSTLIVVLHRSFEDSAIYKQRPRYVTRLDRDGNFVFRNLPADSFALYALGDAGLARRYTNPSQTFAFAANAVASGTDTTYTLYAYKETGTSQGTGATTSAPSAEKRLRLTSNLTGNQQDLLTNLQLNFERPLRTFDSAGLRLYTDSSFTPAPAYSFLLDSSRRSLRLQTTWIENRPYHLVLDKNFATDSAGNQLLKTDTLSFRTRSRSDYGNLSIRLRGVDSTQNPVLLLVQANQVMLAAPVKTGSFTQPLFLPGDYELRLLYDRNNNGRWDAGKFFGLRRQPELVRPLQKITVKSGTENEVELTVPASNQ